MRPTDRILRSITIAILGAAVVVEAGTVAGDAGVEGRAVRVTKGSEPFCHSLAGGEN
jgi:hypothetical protein